MSVWQMSQVFAPVKATARRSRANVAEWSSEAEPLDMLDGQRKSLASS